MHIKTKTKPRIHNRFDIYKKNAVTGEEKQVGYAENIVLDAMWARLCSGSTYFVNIHYGTGTGTLSAARTSLFTHLGTAAASNVETVRAIPTSHWRRSIVLGLTTANGAELTEVGIAYGSTASNLVTHAQIRDMNGNVISIEKEDVDIITIYATVYITLIGSQNPIQMVKAADNALLTYLLGGSFPSASFMFDSGVSSDTSDFCDGRLGGNLATISGTWSNDVANKKRNISTVRLNTDAGNGHISGIVIAGSGRLNLPATGVYSGLELSNVPIGSGDGETTRYVLPSNNIDKNTIVAKVDGASTTVTKLPFSSMVVAPDVFYFNKLNDYISRATPIFRGKGGTVGVSYVYHPSLGFAKYKFVFNGVEHLTAERTMLTTENMGREMNYTTLSYLREAINNDASVSAWRFNDENVIHMNGAPAFTATLSGAVSGGASRSMEMDSSGSVFAVMQGDSPYVRVFDMVSEVWVERTQISGLTGASSIYMSANGNRIFVIDGTATVYVFDWNGTSWSGDNISTGATIKDIRCSESGNTIIVDHGTTAKVFGLSGSTWTDESAPIITNEYFQSKSLIDISPEGDRVFWLRNNADTSSSTVYVYDKVDGEWVQTSSVGRDLVGSTAGTVGTTLAIFDTRLIFIRAGRDSGGAMTCYLMDVPKNRTRIKFATAPAVGAVITADYTVLGIHKTDQRVIDISGEIQFGEPTP